MWEHRSRIHSWAGYFFLIRQQADSGEVGPRQINLGILRENGRSGHFVAAIGSPVARHESVCNIA